MAAVRESDDEAGGRSKHVHWGSVELSGFSSDVAQDAEARKPASKQPSDPIRESNIDLRQPPLAEPHEQDSGGGDGDDDYDRL